METLVIELTDEQKIEILEGAKDLLGPNGENWTKACWWGIKYTDEQIEEQLRMYGYESRSYFTDEEFAVADAENDGALTRAPLETNSAYKADTWCLMGALEESAYRLGIVPERDSSERLAAPISLQELVHSKNEWRSWSVIDVNDNPNTTWDMVRDLLDERLAQLRTP